MGIESVYTFVFAAAILIRLVCICRHDRVFLRAGALVYHSTGCALWSLWNRFVQTGTTSTVAAVSRFARTRGRHTNGISDCCMSAY